MNAYLRFKKVVPLKEWIEWLNYFSDFFFVFFVAALKSTKKKPLLASTVNKMSKEVSLKDFYNNPGIEEEEQDSEQDSDFVPEGKISWLW